MRPFSFQATGQVSFGPGVSSQIGGQRPLKKLSKIAVLTDAGVRGAGLVERVTEPLGDRLAFIDDEVVPDADRAHVDAVAERVRAEGVEALIAVGGGSVIDTAKAVAAVCGKDKPLAELEGFATIRKALMPVVAVPTTAGTGAESTQFVVVLDRQNNRKLILADLSLVPALAVLDPELSTGMPRSLTAATGVDALTHAVEALGSKMANPVGDALALAAIRTIIGEGALARSLEDGADVEARGAMLVAANLAGQAISTNMLGACHAFAHALGAVKGVPHGVANGVFLVDVMRLNLEKVRGRYAGIGSALGADGPELTQAEHAIDRVENLIHEVAGVPRTLSALDVTEADLEPIASLVMLDPDLATNPVALTETERVMEILRARL